MLGRRLLSHALYSRRQNTLLHVQVLARSLSTDKNHSVEIVSYLETLGIDGTLHKGIFKAFESMHGKDVRVEVMQSFGEEGMKALAASVEIEQAKRQGHGKRPSADVLVKIPHHNTDFKLKWKMGDSLLELAEENEELLGEYMEGTCGGNMSCCTCHVYVEQPEFRELLPAPEESELDMLDLAYEPKDSSRLGCQVKLTPIIMGAPIQLEFTIPAGVNNVWN